MSNNENSKNVENTRGRSPNYPVIGLREAISKVEVLFKKENTHIATREVIAKAIGYNGINGASVSVISALGKYGMLESTGGGSKISGLALDIILPKSDAERKEAIRTAALLPTLFSELHSHYGDTVPSDNNLQAYLVRKGFSPTATTAVIRAYKETLEYVNHEAQGFITDAMNDHPTERLTPNQIQPQADGHIQSLTSRTSGLAFPVSEQLSREISVPIAENCDVRSVFTGVLTQEAMDTYISLLELIKKTLPTKDISRESPHSIQEKPSVDEADLG